MYEVGHTVESGHFKFNGFEGHATGLDYRLYFNLIGQHYSMESDVQMASFGNSDVNVALYASASSVGYWRATATHS